MSSSVSTSSSSDSEGPSSSSAPKQKVLKRKRQLEVETSSDSDDTSNSSGSESEREDEVAPALSHAKRRREKKKEEKAQKAETSSTKKRKLQDGSAAYKSPSAIKKEKRQNSVWVGNLYFKATPGDLRGFFDGVGEITRIHMPMKAGKKGENMGFAYIDFASPDQKVIAITLSERDFQGRRLLIKDGDDFSGRPAPVKIESQNAASVDPEDQTTAKSATSTGSTGLSKTAQKILKVQKQPAGPTLFLGNLGFETTEKSIMQLLEAHRGLGRKEGYDEKEGGSNTSKPVDKWIRKIRLGTFEDSGNCKGWAFVDFTSTEHATAALVNPRNHRLDGRNLVVEYASAEAVRRGGGGSRPIVDEGLGLGGSSSRRSKPKRGGHPTGGNEMDNRNGDREGRRVSRTPKVEANRQAAVANAGPEVSRSPATAKVRDHGNNAGYRGVKGRSTPGAALAMAKRESAAIVTSKGQKITF